MLALYGDGGADTLSVTYLPSKALMYHNSLVILGYQGLQGADRTRGGARCIVTLHGSIDPPDGMLSHALRSREA